MPSDEEAELYAILRNDFLSFVHKCVQTLNPGAQFLPNWHIDAIDFRLRQIMDGTTTRLIVNMPPRYLKSTIVSVAFSAFLLGHFPRRRIICISYGNELAAKHAADFRAIVESEWYRKTFPKMRIKRSTDLEVNTTLGGFRKTTTVNAALTGFGGDCFIIDDPQKADDALSEALRNSVNQWVLNTLMSRLDNKQTSAIILVMQRVHLQDLTGYLTENSDEWTVLSLPAIAEADELVQVGEETYHRRRVGEALHPEHESSPTLGRLRTQLGPSIFSAQYQQSPVPLGGAIIKRKWLRYYDRLPDRDKVWQVLLSIDAASKTGPQNDWTVATVWYVINNQYYLAHLVRDRFEYPDLRQTMIELANHFRPTVVLIEDASAGTALAQELQTAGHWNVELIPVDRDKVTRLYVQQYKFSAGLVLFPKDAPYMPMLERELLMFPQFKTDDIVDSISLALGHQAIDYDYSYSGWN
jgi:predicted phage terminase large subunit-like protein